MHPLDSMASKVDWTELCRALGLAFVALNLLTVHRW